VSGSFDSLLIVAAVGYVMARRVIGEPAQGKRMLLLPVVLVAMGLSDVSKAGHNPTAVGYLIASAAVSVVLGAMRGASTRLSAKDGIVYVHYRGLTILLWAVNLAVKFGANAAFQHLDKPAATAAGNSLLLTLGAGMLFEGLVTLSRALRTDQQVIWSKGKDGQAHRTSPFLDGMQSRMTHDGWPQDPRSGGALSALTDALRTARNHNAPNDNWYDQKH
jgi:hypothetical protein